MCPEYNTNSCFYRPERHINFIAVQIYLFTISAIFGIRQRTHNCAMVSMLFIFLISLINLFLSSRKVKSLKLNTFKFSFQHDHFSSPTITTSFTTSHHLSQKITTSRCHHSNGMDCRYHSCNSFLRQSSLK